MSPLLHHRSLASLDHCHHLLKMALQLATLPEVERLSPTCIRILGGNPSKFTLQGTNTYLLGRGPRRLLVDTGEGRPSWAAALRRVLADEGATIAAALLTHWHGDHVGGVRDLLGIVGTSAGAGAGAEEEPKLYKHQPGLHAVEGVAPGRVLDITQGQRFAVDGATLTAHYAPGHAADHMVFALAEEDALFAGDNVLGQGTAVFEDLATYLASLGKMEVLFAGRAYPGHGPVVDDGPARIREYVAHRRAREEQIVATLRGANEAAGGRAAWEPMQLVQVIYRDVPENLHLPALGGVVQVLQKLRQEGRASENEDGKWVLGDRPAL